MQNELADRVTRLQSRIRQLHDNPPEMPTLVYFDIIGIGWPIRCLLNLQKVEYELIQISIQQWAYRDSKGDQPLKSAFRNGHVPLYVDQDVNLNQSNIILMHLAEQHGLLGDSYTEKLAILEVNAHAYDALFHFSGMLQINIKMGISDDVADARLKA